MIDSFRIIFLLPLFLLACTAPKNENQVVEEENIAPTSIEWVTYEATQNSNNKHIVLVSGDEEYRSEEALPQLAKILTERHGFKSTVLFAQNPAFPGVIDPNYSYHIPGLAQLEQADLMILFTRFRALPAEQMQHIEDYLLAGKPLIAIRTATHTFHFKDSIDHPFQHYDSYYEGDIASWQGGFGKKVLGETWYQHHGKHKHQSTRGIIAPGAENHPIVNGIENGAIWVFMLFVNPSVETHKVLY